MLKQQKRRSAVKQALRAWRAKATEILRPNSGVAKWLRDGRPNPPPAAIKARNLLVLADLFDLDTLVETGTYQGGMIVATHRRFKQIYSIELDPSFARAATVRFRHLHPKVQIIEGDSGKVLPELVGRLPDRVLFWLDGHFSGIGTAMGDTDTPILAEVETIASNRRQCRDVIVIDDARLFRHNEAYPRLEDFLAVLGGKFGRQTIVADDSIFVLPLPAADLPPK